MLLVSKERLLLLLNEQGLLLRVLLRQEVRWHWDRRQRWSRTPWPHLNRPRPGVEDARPGPIAASGLLLLLGRCSRGA
jgi:hypothetical protein